jgi:GNAT superfamily N-acetyltransferase
MLLRQLRHGDLNALPSLSAAVGWPHREDDWALFLSLGEGLAACAPDGAILGTAMRWRWSPACATVGMVLVAPSQQGKGLGRQLMQALLDAEPERAVMLNATQAGIGLYERLGFRPIGMVCQYQGIVATTPQQSALRPAQAADLSALVAMDAAAFGAARAPLIERLMAEGDIRVIDRGGRLRGFAVRRPFGRGETIGARGRRDRAHRRRHAARLPAHRHSRSGKNACRVADIGRAGAGRQRHDDDTRRMAEDRCHAPLRPRQSGFGLRNARCQNSSSSAPGSSACRRRTQRRGAAIA